MLRIHEDTEQLRYSPKGPHDRSSEQNQVADAFLQPLSAYRPGGAAGIKAGMPVSLARLEDIVVPEVKNSSDPAIVRTDSSVYKWSIGLAQEPGLGNATDSDDPNRRYVHVVNHGKFTWDRNDLADAIRKQYIQFPPNDGVNFLWTYDDVGKTVYVSNKTGEEGMLTLDITEAYANGGNIITIGHLADAPIPGNIGSGPKLTIEVHTDGDSRSIQDSTEFDAYILAEPGQSIIPNPGASTGPSKIVCVKLLYNVAGGITYGKIIMSEKDVLDNDENSPVAAFVAEPGKDYANQKVVIHRFGIVTGRFGYVVGDTGKDLYLSHGNVSTTTNTALYEYKVGVVLEVGDPNRQRILIDCRYPKFFRAFDPVGKVKPLYKTNSGEYLTDPGYVAVDVNKNYCIKRGGMFGVLETEYATLAEVILHQGIAEFFDSAGNKVNISNSTTFADVNKPGYYFKLTSMIYQIGGQTIGAQIKYSREGSPEEMQYLWPMKVYSMVVNGTSGGKPGRNPASDLSSVLDITDLVNLGENRSGAINIDDFEVQMIIDDRRADGTTGPINGVVLSPGISPVQFVAKIDKFIRVDENNNKYDVEVPTYRTMYCGYDWQYIKRETKNFEGVVIDTKHYLMLITNPDASTDVNLPTHIPNANCRGICWPGVAFLSEGTPSAQLPPPPYSAMSNLNLKLIVRRRPAFYHSLMLNQLYSDSTWNADIYTDGNNIGVKGALFFGAGGIQSPTNPSEAPFLDVRYANEFRMAEFGTFDADKKYTNPNFPVVSEIHAFGKVETTVGLKSVSQAIARYYPRLESGDRDLSKYEIRTIYDFDSNSISWSANLTGKWASPPTALDPLFPPTDILAQRVRNKGAYLTFGVDVGLVNGVLVDPKRGRSALKTLREVPVNFFLYMDEIEDPTAPDNNITKRISPIQSVLISKVGTLAMIANTKHEIYNIQSAAWYDAERPKGSDPFASYGPQIPKKNITQYSYNLPLEGDFILEDIRSAYLPEKGTDFSLQYLQTNIGLLTQAAGEAQTRLLRLERMLFGIDTETIPGYVDAATVPALYGSLANGLSDQGVARTVGWLDRFGFFEYDQSKIAQGLFAIGSMFPLMKDLIFGTGAGSVFPVGRYYYPWWLGPRTKYAWSGGIASNKPMLTEIGLNPYWQGRNTLLDPIKWLMHHLHRNVPQNSNYLQSIGQIEPDDSLMMPNLTKAQSTYSPKSAIDDPMEFTPPLQMDELYSDVDGEFFVDHKSSNISIYGGADTRLTLDSHLLTLNKWSGLPRGFIRVPSGEIRWGIDGGALIHFENHAQNTVELVRILGKYPANMLSGVLHDFAQRFAFLQSQVFDENAGITPEYGLISRGYKQIGAIEKRDFFLRGFTGTGKYGYNQRALKFYLSPKGSIDYVPDEEDPTKIRPAYSSVDYSSPWWNAFSFSNIDDKIVQMGKTKIGLDLSRGQYIGTRIVVKNQASPVAGKVTIDWNQYCSTKGAVPNAATDSLIVTTISDSNTPYSKTPNSPEGYEADISNRQALLQPVTYPDIDKNIAISIDGRRADNTLIPSRFVSNAILTKPDHAGYDPIKYVEGFTGARPPDDRLNASGGIGKASKLLVRFKNTVSTTISIPTNTYTFNDGRRVYATSISGFSIPAGGEFDGIIMTAPVGSSIYHAIGEKIMLTPALPSGIEVIVDAYYAGEDFIAANNENEYGFDTNALYVATKANLQLTGDSAKSIILSKPRDALITSLETTISDFSMEPDLNGRTLTSFKLKQAWEFVSRITPTSTKWYGVAVTDPRYESTLFLRQNPKNEVDPLNNNPTTLGFELGMVKPGDASITRIRINESNGTFSKNIFFSDLNAIKSRFATYSVKDGVVLPPSNVDIGPTSIGIIDYPIELDYDDQSIFGKNRIVATYANGSTISSFDHSTTNHLVYREYKPDAIERSAFDIKINIDLPGWNIVFEPGDGIKISGLSPSVNGLELITTKTQSIGKVEIDVHDVKPDAAYLFETEFLRNNKILDDGTLTAPPADHIDPMLPLSVTSSPFSLIEVDEKDEPTMLSVQFSPINSGADRGSIKWHEYKNGAWEQFDEGIDTIMVPTPGSIGTKKEICASVSESKTIPSEIEIELTNTDAAIPIERWKNSALVAGAFTSKLSSDLMIAPGVSDTLTFISNNLSAPLPIIGSTIGVASTLPSSTKATITNSYAGSDGSKAKLSIEAMVVTATTIPIGTYSFTISGITFSFTLSAPLVLDAGVPTIINTEATTIGEIDVDAIVTAGLPIIIPGIGAAIGPKNSVWNDDGSNPLPATIHVSLSADESFDLYGGLKLSFELDGKNYSYTVSSLVTVGVVPMTSNLFVADSVGQTVPQANGTDIASLIICPLFIGTGTAVVNTAIPGELKTSTKYSTTAKILVASAIYRAKINRVFAFIDQALGFTINEATHDDYQGKALILNGVSPAATQKYEIWFHDALLKTIDAPTIFDAAFRTIGLPRIASGENRYRIKVDAFDDGAFFACGRLDSTGAIVRSATNVIPITIKYIGHNVALDTRIGFLRTIVKPLFGAEIVIPENTSNEASINVPIGPFKVKYAVNPTFSSREDEYKSLTALYASTESRTMFASTNRAIPIFECNLNGIDAREWVLRNIDAVVNNFVANIGETGVEHTIIDEDETIIRVDIENAIHKRIYPSSHPNVNVRGRFMEPLWSMFTTKQVKSAVPKLISTILGYGRQDLSLWQTLNVNPLYPNTKGLSGENYGLPPMVISQNNSLADSIKSEAYWPPAIGQIAEVTSHSNRTDGKDQRMMDLRQVELATDSVYFSIKDIMQAAKTDVDWYLPFEHVMVPFPDILNNTYWETLDGTPPAGFNPASSIFFNGGTSETPQMVITLKNEGLQPSSRDFIVSKFDVNPDTKSGTGYFWDDEKRIHVAFFNWRVNSEYNYHYTKGSTMITYQMLEITDLGKAPPFRQYLGFESAQVSTKKYVKPIISLPLPPRVLALSGNNGKLEMTVSNISSDPNVKYEFLYSLYNNPLSANDVKIVNMGLTGAGSDTKEWSTSELTPGIKYYCWVRATNVYGTQLHIGSEYGGLEVIVSEALKGMFFIEGKVTMPNGGAWTNADVSLTDPAHTRTSTVATNAAGIYRFSDLPAGMYIIYVNSPQYSGQTTTEIISVSRTGIDLQLAESLYEVTGKATLMGASMIPAAGAQIQMIGPATYFSVADADGNFEFTDSNKVKYGEYEYKVTYDGGNMLHLSNPTTLPQFGPVGYCQLVKRILMDPNPNYDGRFDNTNPALTGSEIPSWANRDKFDPQNPVQTGNWNRWVPIIGSETHTYTYYGPPSTSNGFVDHWSRNQPATAALWTYLYEPTSDFFIGKKTIPVEHEFLLLTMFDIDPRNTGNQLAQVLLSKTPEKPWNNFDGVWTGLDPDGAAITLTLINSTTAMDRFGSYTLSGADTPLSGATRTLKDMRYMQGRVTVVGTRTMSIVVPYRLANIYGRISGNYEGAKISIMQNGRFPTIEEGGNPNEMIEGFTYPSVFSRANGQFEIIGLSQSPIKTQMTITYRSDTTVTRPIEDEHGNIIGYETDSGPEQKFLFFLHGDSVWSIPAMG